MKPFYEQLIALGATIFIVLNLAMGVVGFYFGLAYLMSTWPHIMAAVPILWFGYREIKMLL